MIPVTYKLRDQYAGDTFRSLRITATETSGGVTTPIDLNGVTIKSQFKKNNIVALDLVQGDGITIVDAEAGVFELGPFTNPEGGTYQYDVQFQDNSTGFITTYLKGKMTVLDQQTT